MRFRPANDATGGSWLSKALYAGNWGTVSGAVPSGFEAYAAVRHPAWRFDCTEQNLSGFRSGSEGGRPIRWAEVAKSNVPVVYGQTLYSEGGITRSRNTQYRLLRNDGWVLHELSVSDLVPVLRPGDVWIAGPREGTLEPDLAGVVQGVIARETADPGHCWFGIWEGFGYLTDAHLAAPTITAPGRRWHLFRGSLGQLERSFAPGWFEHQTANLVWPEDRSWCLATEIDGEVTYVAGSTELVSAILDEPGLEAVPALLDDRLTSLCDVLAPVVDKPGEACLLPGFESREVPA